jgi:oligoendopeptidase F
MAPSLRAGGTLRHKELLAPFGLGRVAAGFLEARPGRISGFIDELARLSGDDELEATS